MATHFRPFFFLILVLVLALLPTLQGSRRTLQDLAPAFPPYLKSAPGSSPSPGPGSGPELPPPVVPPPELPPPVVPPPSTGGGGGGGVVPPKDNGSKSSGLSGGQKAGITLGVLAGAGLVGFAALVYMKRRSNIQRARFGVLARRSQL